MQEEQRQQDWAQQNYQYRLRLEQLQEAQLTLRKNLRYLEEQQEAFFDLQQKEQRLYTDILSNCEAEERPFIQTRGEEGLHLAKKAQREFDEERLALKTEERGLFDQEEFLNSEYRAFLKNDGKGQAHGT